MSESKSKSQPGARSLGIFKNSEPQIKANKRRFMAAHLYLSVLIRGLKSVFAPSACFAVRLKYVPQRARRTQREEQ